MKIRFTFVRSTVCCGEIDIDIDATEEEIQETVMNAIEDGNFDEDDSYDENIEIEKEEDD